MTLQKKCLLLAAGLSLLGGGGWRVLRPAEAQDRSKNASAVETRDYYPELKKKIVPIISFGSNLNVGAAQVQGEEADVNRVKAVAQLETDWKDRARIKILVPVQAESLSHIDRVPGVSVSAIADYKIQD